MLLYPSGQGVAVAEPAAQSKDPKDSAIKRVILAALALSILSPIIMDGAGFVAQVLGYALIPAQRFPFFYLVVIFLITFYVPLPVFVTMSWKEGATAGLLSLFFPFTLPYPFDVIQYLTFGTKGMGNLNLHFMCFTGRFAGCSYAWCARRMAMWQENGATVDWIVKPSGLPNNAEIGSLYETGGGFVGVDYVAGGSSPFQLRFGQLVVK